MAEPTLPHVWEYVIGRSTRARAVQGRWECVAGCCRAKAKRRAAAPAPTTSTEGTQGTPSGAFRGVGLDQLTIQTYNVWFEQHLFAQRHAQQMLLFQEHRADIICLQEVIPSYISLLVANEYVKANYVLSDVDGSFVGDYGCIMLVRRSLARAGLRFSMHSLPTRMGRHLLVAHLVVNGESLVVGTVHLESQANAAFRKQQLGVVWGVLFKADASHAVLCGDFNFSDGWPECRSLDPSFQDVWLQLHPAAAPECSYMTPPPGSADAGCTMPRTASRPPWRPDRIMLRSSSFKPCSIDIVGDMDMGVACEQCNKVKLRPCTPSDHFSLVMQLDWHGRKLPFSRSSKCLHGDDDSRPAAASSNPPSTGSITDASSLASGVSTPEDRSAGAGAGAGAGSSSAGSDTAMLLPSPDGVDEMGPRRRLFFDADGGRPNV